MTQNQLTTKRAIVSIGEEIGYELGTQMVNDFQVANPNDVHSYVIGRNIIDQILAQPGCVGMRFYNAYNEMGEKTLVYVGLDAKGKTILEYTTVDNQGKLGVEKGIVADRIINPRFPPQTTTTEESEDFQWGWNID